MPWLDADEIRRPIPGPAGSCGRRLATWNVTYSGKYSGRGHSGTVECLSDQSAQDAFRVSVCVMAAEKATSPMACTITKRKIHKTQPASDHFLYINRGTALHPLLKKVRRQLIQKEGKKVTLCGMGAAITKASILALQIQDMIGGESVCSLLVRTGSVDIVDEVVPNDPDLDITTQVRKNSKIEIDLIARRR